MSRHAQRAVLCGARCAAQCAILAAVFLAPLSAAEAPDAKDAPSVAAADATASVSAEPIPPPHLEVGIEIPDVPLVKRYHEQYTSPDGLKYLAAVMRRSAPYRDFILDRIRTESLPESLLFLPVIESGYSVSAVSRSGATGIWQFMRNSVGGFGIRITDWVDERRDPWISTDAALRKLKENYAYLGDWYLALAAYNCGLGAVQRAVKRAGKADYWYLCEKGYLKRETVHYVPKFLAISRILADSAAYGIDWGGPSPLPPTSTLPVKRAVDVGLLAKEIGLEPAILKAANPALHYSITPPDAVYALRVPTEHEEAVRGIIDDKTRLLVNYYLYKVKSGDTLYALALHYGISVEMILQSNPGVRASALKIGTKLVIPALKEVAAYSGKRDSANRAFDGTYTVKQGDTLWSIALAHNVQVETLAERNGLEVQSVLRLGKTLRVPIL